MAERHYYDLLGLEPNASAEEIKQAFRRLARQYHPDVNRDDPDAEERFKQIGEAYAVLSDPQKRAEYDRWGRVVSEGGFRPEAFSEFEDLFGGSMGSLFDLIFGRGSGRFRADGRDAGPQRGADLRYDLEITLEEAAAGVSREIQIPRRQSCPVCFGNRSEPGHDPISCPTCGGVGQIRQMGQSLFGISQMVTTCPRCRGAGRVITHPCSRCEGAGRIEVERTITLDIPAGIDQGVHLRVTGEGDAGRQGGPAGDLYVAIHIAPHERFRRRGQDLYTPLTIGIAQAALGSEITIPTLWGEETLTIPPGTQHGELLPLRGQGMPELRSDRKGTLHLQVEIEVPTHLSEEEKEALLHYAQLRGEEVRAPEGWLARLRQRLGRGR